MQKKITLRPNGSQKPSWYNDLLKDISSVVYDALDGFYDVEFDDEDDEEEQDCAQECCDKGVEEEVQRDITHDMWMNQHPEWHEIRIAYKDGKYQSPAIDDGGVDEEQQIKNTLALCYALAAYVYANVEEAMGFDGKKELGDAIMEAVGNHIRDCILQMALENIADAVMDSEEETKNDK